MGYILYINGKLIDLAVSSPIAQTKQVNDIASLENRQSNFTNQFIAPPTANNIRAMDKLYLVGNQSNIPYQKNEANLFDSDTGLCLIYKGWANINQTTNKGYEIYVYDGAIDIYKAIENKVCSELNLTEIKHEKTVANVIASFSDTLPYKYILADYNGKSRYDGNKINIDYLVPSIRMSWIIQQIETFTGITLNGSFKTNPDYLNLWITYPKGASDKLESEDIYTSTDLIRSGVTELKVISTDFTTGDLTLSGDNKTFSSDAEILSIAFEVIVDFRVRAVEYLFTRWVKSEIYLVVDGVEMLIGDNGTEGEMTTLSYSFNISKGSSFYLKMKPVLGKNQQLVSISGGFQRIDFRKYVNVGFDFVDEFSKLPMKTVLNEIVWRFGLTVLKSKYTSECDFKTLAEITDTSNAIDWSSKFVSLEGEKYIYGNYAQYNYMRYKYIDSEANHNDGSIIVNNKNLEESKTIIISSIYSPERLLSNSLGFTSNVYKLWEKELKDDGTVEYKALSDKFYLMRSFNKSFDEITIGSDFTNVESTITTALVPVESFKGMTFNNIITDNYKEIVTLINNSKINSVNMNLTNRDVSEIDFSVPYYIEQLGAYFLLNKINNFIPHKPTKCDLVKINFNQATHIPDYSEYYSDDYSH